MTQYLHSISTSPTYNNLCLNNKNNNQCSESLRVDNPEAVLQQLLISSQDSDLLNRDTNKYKSNQKGYNYQPYSYQNKANFRRQNIQNNDKLSIRQLQMSKDNKNIEQMQSISEDVLQQSKQLCRNQKLIQQLLKQLSQQSQITQNLMQEMSNNLNTITYYQKIWHHYNQQCTLLDQSAQIHNTIPNHSNNYNYNPNYNSINMNAYEKQKISICDFVNYGHKPQENTIGIQQKEQKIKKPSQRIVQSIQVYRSIQSKQNKQQNKSNLMKNDCLLNFSVNSVNSIENSNKSALKKLIKNKQATNYRVKQFQSQNSIEQQLKAIKEINKGYKSPNSLNKPNLNYVSIKNFASIDKSLSTDESVDQLFANIELAQKNSTAYNRFQNKSTKMYKKIAPHAPWGQNNKSSNFGWTSKPCSGRKTQQKSNLYRDHKYKLYNKGQDPSKNQFLELNYPNRSYNIQKSNSKNQINKCKVRNNSIISNSKLLENSPQIQIDKNSGRNKVMTVKIDVRGCK